MRSMRGSQARNAVYQAYRAVSARIGAVSACFNAYQRPYRTVRDTPRQPIRQVAYRIRTGAVSGAYPYPIRIGYGYGPKLKYPSNIG